MIKLFSTITLSISAFFVSAQSTELCLPQSTQFDPALLTTDKTIRVSSDAALMIRNSSALFNGNVTIASPNSMINANVAQIDDNGKQVTASGDVLYRDQALQVESQGVELNSELQLLQMQDTEYQFKDIAGRGSADLFSLSG